jgi:multiple sugar transport system ATP-binding protein
VATVVGSPPTNFITGQVGRQSGELVIEHPAFVLRASGERHPLQEMVACERVQVGVRPEDVYVFNTSPGQEAIEGHVAVIEPLGAETIVDLRVGPDLIKAVVPPTQRLEEGSRVWLNFEASRVHVFDAASGVRLYTTGQAESLECLRPMPA